MNECNERIHEVNVVLLQTKADFSEESVIY